MNHSVAVFGRSAWTRACLVLLSLMMVPALAACGEDPNARFGTSVTTMDHDPSDTFVRNVFVDDSWAGEGGRGGKTVCCISLPVRWHQGLQSKVRWERCEPYGKNCQWHEKMVSIHRYDEVGMAWLHIVSDDEVLIIPSMLGPGHPDYPGPDLPKKDFFKR
ncbi:DUF3304 domain-containing protein [Aerolutibacter ruishenii]|uniref:Uncharacterized protein DUF3304 n=1 Tax=Aerolutibacter ruishenii TaxID=686800 RepID=A0A562M0S3_9GAMM|nr:DUF3304 domain-containing protein [Lysobacter ruishenii]TWI13378.1 uncharacterized protein DUF3304 [Lysobacter ruishenii]